MSISWPENRILVTNAIKAIPGWQAMTDQQITDILNEQSEVEDGPINASVIRRAAMEASFTRTAGANTRSVWGSLQAMSNRDWSEGTQAADHAKNDVIIAASSFLSMLRELEDSGAPLIRGNALWNRLDVDLHILTNLNAAGASLGLPATSGSPILTQAQANWMRAQGDRTRPVWVPDLSPDVIAVQRAL